MKNALLIVNPFSGKKRGEREASGIREKLRHKGFKSITFVSHNVNELEKFIKETNLNAFDVAGIVGGDGTMHAFLNAVLKCYETVPVPVALFPCGTGNAFNFDIGCNTVEETLNCIFAGKPVYVDIAEVNYGDERMWSFNILGCGLVAEINRLAEKLRWIGASRYTVASVIKLLSNPHNKLKITSGQGELEGEYSFVLACNTRYTGKGMMMAPNAKLSDGKFDVIVVKACSAFKLLKLFPKIFEGKHLGADVLEYFQTGSLNVSCETKYLPTNVDGEMKGYTPFSLRVHTEKLRVLMK